MNVEVRDTVTLFGIGNHVELIKNSAITVRSYYKVTRSYGNGLDLLKETVVFEDAGRIGRYLDTCANLEFEQSAGLDHWSPLETYLSKL